MADDDGGGPENGDDLEFSTATWSTDKQSYGLFYLMVIRQGLDVELKEKPKEFELLKVMDSTTANATLESSVRKIRKNGNAHHAEHESEISEGEPHEESDVASWPGKKASWWRVHSSLGEELVVREGLSLASSELLRMSPGESVQQAGAARMLKQDRAAYCIRLPVKPRGWVTADASRAGGPRYLVSASAPRWRVVHSAEKNGESDALVRATAELDSDEVSWLYFGDIVEQAGPSETRGQGIVRMPVTSNITRRSDGDAESYSQPNHAPTTKVFGWVTIDAKSAGGPVFFKPTVDQTRRRRKPGY